MESEPGSVRGVQLVVSDIHNAYAELVERGVEVSEVQELPGGSFVFSVTLTATAGLCSKGLLRSKTPKPRGDHDHN